MDYSKRYKKIREEIETIWPQWKIDYANSLIISKHCKPLVKREKK